MRKKILEIVERLLAEEEVREKRTYERKGIAVYEMGELVGYVRPQ